jgi:licheninase
MTVVKKGRISVRKRIKISATLVILFCLLVAIPAVSIADDYEPDDIMAVARWITVGNEFQNHEIDPATDTDWMKFDAVEGYGYVIELANELGGDVRCRLYNENRNSVSDEISTSKEWKCPFTGTYYLKMWERYSDHWASYQLRILPAYWNGTAVWDSRYEPDDTKHIAYLSGTDGSVYHHKNGNSADKDWVRFSAEEGRTYTFSLTNEIGGDFRFIVYDATTHSLSGEQSTSWAWLCPVTGTYYVKIWERYEDQIGAFDFSITSDVVDYAVDIPISHVTLYLDTAYGVDSYQLIANCSNGSDDIVWSSGDSSVVSVGSDGLLVEEPVGGSESYMVYVQFRPGATEGPLDTTELSDVVAEYQSHQINWSVSPMTPTPVYPSYNETIGNLTPTFLWSTFQDGGDGGTQAGYQLRVRCDDEGDLVVYDTGLVESTSVHSHTYTSEGYSDPTPGFTDNFRDAWNDTYSANGIWRKSGPWAIPSNNTFLRQENVSVQNGMVILTVPADEYEGGQIESVDSTYHYGYYEARIKASAEPGVVNAFFMWSPTGNNNEIDVEFLSNEFGLDSGKVHFVLHPHNGLDEGQYHIEVNLPFNPSDSFNNYAFEWSVNYVNFFVNGQLVANMPASEGCPVPSQPGNLLLSNWSGGIPNWGDGPPTVSTTLQVEWVRFVPENSEGKVSLPLEWGKHYHWHVRYRDSDGDWSDWSADNNPDLHQDFYTPTPTTVYVDDDNTSGVEDGSVSNPF